MPAAMTDVPIAADLPGCDLEHFPKPPVDGVATSVGAQAMGILLWGLVLPALAGAFYAVSKLATLHKGWEIAAIVMLAIWPTPLLIGGLMWLSTRMQEKKLRELAGGMYWVWWQYQPDQWRDHCARSEKNLRWIGPGFAAGGAAVALVFAGMVHGDEGRLFFDSVLGHYGVCGLVGSAGGGVVGLICRRLAGITQRLRRTKPAQALIGPEGVYITGQFSPMSAFGHQFRRAIFPNDPPRTLRFVFAVKTKHGWTENEVLVPIPPGQDDAANAVQAAAMQMRQA